MNRHEGNDPRKPRLEAERQERVKVRLLLAIGVLVGLIALVLHNRFDPFGIAG